MYHNSLKMSTRRNFLKGSAALTAMFFLGSKVQAQTGLPISQTLYRPRYWHSVGGDGTICLENLSYFYPFRNNVALPTTMRPGSRPDCAVQQSTFLNAQGFAQTNNRSVFLSPSNMTRASVGITEATVPHQPSVSVEDWRSRAAGMLDLNTRKMTVLGDWNLTSSQSSSQPLPDSPANWQHWKDIEVANEIGEINKERDLPLPLTLKTGLHELWTAPVKEVALHRTLAEICPVMAATPTYTADLLSTFLYVDERPGFFEAQIWSHIDILADPVVNANCGIEVEGWQFIEQSILLEATPFPAVKSAQLRAYEKTRIWPISNMEFVPVGGGVSAEVLGNVALIVVGALLIIAVIALIAGAPQIMIVAAVAAA